MKTGHSALLFEHDEDLFDLMARRLHYLGFQVTQVLSQRQASAAVAERPYRLAMIDTTSPRADGFRLARFLLDSCDDLSVILLVEEAEHHSPSCVQLDDRLFVIPRTGDLFWVDESVEMAQECNLTNPSSRLEVARTDQGVSRADRRISESRPAQAAGLRLLIAHSGESLLDAGHNFFWRQGFETVVARNAVECCAKLREFQPDVLLLHRELLGGGCDEVLAHLRAGTVMPVPAVVQVLVQERLEDSAALVVPPVQACLRIRDGLGNMLDAVICTLLDVVREVAPVHTESQTLSPAPAGRPMEILLVEDDLVQAQLVTEAVRRGHFDHRMNLICDGQEALDFLFNRGIYHSAPRPDLILLDLRLPVMDGLDVLEQIRGDHELELIPVVIMTSSQEEEDRMYCEKLAVEGYLIKPVNWENFQSLLKQLRHFWRADVVLPQAVRGAAIANR